ncbi:MAG TPA: helix-turn-helix domain-containing protein [Candidatus Saccharimonadales bacterium]|nr:helix-turn-helix domain-containing protein [Candidatus Saccharimonadales bacterium]
MPSPYQEETRQEKLTRQFYEWEMRGRGWKVFEHPVALEPPFRPFFGHYVPGPANPILDDGRKPTFLSSLVERFKTPRPAPLSTAIESPEPSPSYLEDDAPPVVELQITLPPEMKITKEAASQFLMSLGRISGTISFEIVATCEKIVVQAASSGLDQRQVREQLLAYFPDAIFADQTGYLKGLWNASVHGRKAVVEFGLSQEFMRPIRSFDRFEPDPLAGIIGAMVELAPGEIALLQILFAPTRHPWPESILRAVTDNQGDPFFVDDPALVKLATEKTAAPLFATVIRVAACSQKSSRAWQIAQGMGKALHQFQLAASNELIPLTNEEYDDHQHAEDVILRRSRRMGMLLNCEELVSLVHLPSASVRSIKLKRDARKTKAPPALAVGHSLILGENDHAGKRVPVTLSPDQRVQHLYVIGASGSGKSTLLLNMIIQDIHNGEGVAVLDPHGDLIDQVLSRIPEARVNDVVLLDPSDEAYPVGFNILSARSELERNLLASDLVSVFRRLSTSFGDQMTTVLGNAIMAFLESSEGGTLSDLRRFLVEPDYRKSFLETVGDPEIVYYWQREFPLLAGRPQGPILTRLDTFLRPKIIRHMVSQKADRLDFGAIMNGRKILLAKLSQGLIGEENSYLLGTLLVSKINQVAISRQNMAATERKHFFLYVDEFHNFVTPSMAAILAGARKYNLGLILAHQELQQLSNRDSGVASAVISNPYTRVCFRLGDFDAKKLEDGFSFFEARDLQNLGVGQAICRVERAEYDFNLKTIPLPPVEPETAARVRERIVHSSRERYAAKREEVEAILRANRTPPPVTEEPTGGRRRAKPPANEQTPPEREPVAAEASAIPGRGGDHHKYLQDLIKRWAEGRGYSVTLEKPILDGLGIIDVVLEKPGYQPIACEVSVTTTPEHEIRNAEKCIAAGFERIFLIAPDKDTLTRVRARAAAILPASAMKKVQLVLIEEIFSSISVLEARGTPVENTPATESSKEVLTAKEVEALLRIDVKTIYGYVQKGLIPYVRIQSNLRFLKTEVLAWLEQKRSDTKKKGRRG